MRKLLVQTAGHGALAIVGSVWLLPRMTPAMLRRLEAPLAPILRRDAQWVVVNEGGCSIEAGEGSFYRLIVRPGVAGEVIGDKGVTVGLWPG